jgi:RNA methyltransferase, TrmH family
MLSKGLIKIINSLNQKKYREKYQLYIAEGEKLINDLINMGSPVEKIISTKPLEFIPIGIEFIQCQQSELDKLSFLKNNQGIIALVKILKKPLILNDLHGRISIALDGIQDPGNMGTIIRLANWFGIKSILCSFDCVDIYNPKVVQAAMGAIMGVEIYYTELEAAIDSLIQNNDYKVYGAYMEGESIYETNLERNGILIMGNEGKGISEKIEQKISKKISIPSFRSDKFRAESLNVGVATGIIISEIVRQSNFK